MSQDEIDSIEYPPTHEYDLETLTPKGVLAKRMKLYPQSFFKGDSFLDIGCNKGFFSLLAKQGCRKVKGIDYDPKCIDLCKKLGLDVELGTFRDYNPTEKFDRIFMGNIMHYMYRECEGWEFIIKLAAISSGEVLIEAPTGMNCKAMKPVFEKRLRANFNEDEFMKHMNKFFTLISKANSPNNNRYIMHFRRKVQLPMVIHSMSEFDGAKKIKETKESTCYRHGNLIYKIQKNRSTEDEIGYFIASHSPVSNGVYTWMYHYKDGFIGWVERYSEKKSLGHYDKQEEVFKKLCEHNVYLAKLGYTEMDMGTSNFMEDLTMVDKGGVWHIKDIQNIALGKDGYFLKMFRDSFDIPLEYDLIHETLATRDSKKIENMYQGFLQKEEKVKGVTLEILSMLGGIGLLGLVALGIAWYHGGI